MGKRNKRSRKKGKKDRKKSIIPLAEWCGHPVIDFDSAETPPNEKMSEVLADVARPLLDIANQAGTDEACYNAVLMAAVVWNVSRWPSVGEREAGLRKLAEDMRLLSDESPEHLDNLLHMVLSRALSLYPGLDRYIVHVEVEDAGDDLHIYAVSVMVIRPGFWTRLMSMFGWPWKKAVGK